MFAATKTTCPITLAQFMADSGTLELEIAGSDVRFQVNLMLVAAKSRDEAGE